MLCAKHLRRRSHGVAHSIAKQIFTTRVPVGTARPSGWQRAGADAVGGGREDRAEAVDPLMLGAELVVGMVHVAAAGRRRGDLSVANGRFCPEPRLTRSKFAPLLLIGPWNCARRHSGFSGRFSRSKQDRCRVAPVMHDTGAYFPDHQDGAITEPAVSGDTELSSECASARQRRRRSSVVRWR